MRKKRQNCTKIDAEEQPSEAFAPSAYRLSIFCAITESVSLDGIWRGPAPNFSRMRKELQIWDWTTSLIFHRKVRKVVAKFAKKEMQLNLPTYPLAFSAKGSASFAVKRT